MRIEQQQNQNTNIVDNLKQSIGPEEKKTEGLFAKKAAERVEAASNGKSVNLSDATYLKPGMEESETVADQMEKNAAMDAKERKEQMAVLAGTTSEEDYAKMQEDGFALDSTTTNTIVTVTDKIKAELAKAGVDISIFGDDLDWEQLEAIAGSPELATQLATAMQQADVPVTEDNMKEAVQAYQIAGQIQELDDTAVRYLVANHLEPSIANVYIAEFSGGNGYAQQEDTGVDISSFADQVETIIRQAGYQPSEQLMQDSKWLIDQGIPLTPENISYMEQLKQTEIPINEEMLSKSIAVAIAEGKKPENAMLLPGWDSLSKAQHVYDVVNEATDADITYMLDHGMEMNVKNLEYAMSLRQTEADTSEPVSESEISTADNAEYTQKGLAEITARRQLEEIRLIMTSQANYSLLKQGISIDTEPLEQLVEQLKEQENAYYEKLLGHYQVDATEENVALFKETTEKVAEMKTLPAYVLGTRDIAINTINEVHKAGVVLKDRFDQANERYEALMTAPRADLGDSIQKAFQNVDDILQDLDLEVSEANQRAVRILGYNGVEITAETVAQMKAADEEVQRVFKNMTPAVVTQMIKEGVNPLDMEFGDLNDTAEQMKDQNGDAEQQKFAEFLWKLEKNNEITAEERNSYIGIYRLMHQVEATDSAAVGALIQQGAELTMRNLLMAVRSEHRSGKMDYRVDEEFGQQTSSGYEGSSIIDQIEAAYQTNCMKDVQEMLTPERVRSAQANSNDWQNLTPEQLKELFEQVDVQEEENAYAKQQLSQLNESAKVSQDIYEILQKYDIPNTTTNVLAMEAMSRDRNSIYRQIFGKNVKTSDGKVDEEDLEDIKDALIEEFGEAVSSPKAMAEVQEKLGNLAENVMKTMIESDDVTSLDIREMRMLSAQLSIQEKMSRDEQYSVPVMVGDEVVNVSLRIVRGVEKKGTVDIAMESQLRGKIAATFQAKEQGIQGLVATDNRETKDLLQDSAAILEEKMQEEGSVLHFAYVDDLKLEHIAINTTEQEAEEEPADGEAYEVQTTRLYQIAENFIRTIREVL